MGDRQPTYEAVPTPYTPVEEEIKCTVQQVKVSQLNVEYVTPGETSEICVYDMGDWRYGTYRCDYYGGAWNTLTYVDMSFVVGFGNDEQMYRVTN